MELGQARQDAAAKLAVGRCLNVRIAQLRNPLGQGHGGLAQVVVDQHAPLVYGVVCPPDGNLSVGHGRELGAHRFLHLHIVAAVGQEVGPFGLVRVMEGAGLFEGLAGL